MDYELLEKSIRHFPNYDFHFVGRILEQESVDRLSKFKNVAFFGSKQPQELVKMMSAFDVAIIPFVKNEFTRNIYPLKINEYLAAGLPVVSTDFSDLTDFKEVISIADQKDFTSKLSIVIADQQDASLSRIQMAKSNDWSARAEQFEKILSKVGYEAA